MRTIAVFTANRSEFGVLVPILRAIEAHPRLNLALLVAGMHFDDTHGGTHREIAEEGFDVARFLNVERPCNGNADLAAWVGQLTVECGKALSDIRPEFLLVLGDRYELLAPVTAAFLQSIAIGHISGGDMAVGGFADDTVRHTVSRMAHLHFPGTEVCRQRLISMGEESWRVHNVGEPCIDNVLSNDYPSPDEVAASICLSPQQPYILCTVHPVPQQDGQSDLAARETFAAVGEADVQVVITYPNGDPASTEIIAEIEKVKDAPGFVVIKSLGRRRYVPLLRRAAAIVGNSSSGILESVPLHVPAVDLGTRQEGRPHAPSVRWAPFNRERILHEVSVALNDVVFRETVKNCGSPFGDGGCGRKVADILSSVTLDRALLDKRYVFSV